MSTSRKSVTSMQIPKRLGIVVLTTVSGFCCILFCSLSLLPAEEGNWNVPEGFQISLFADNDLAPNIYSMTFDSLGRVVVSGPGYVSILVDENQDGKADNVIRYADGPKSGAQGMVFYGRDLICSGDEGIIRYQDRNQDDRADGKPDLFLKIKTGSEHHAHAIRQGPDGYWYLIAGNFAGVNDSYVTLPASPIKSPRAGTLIRLKPTMKGGEILAHGYRNAYDFDFDDQGDLYTYDSDGERDVSLPWYQPTRVFQMTPGSHAGWVSRSWKQPDSFLNMPPVLARLGRGSPTGVVCYRHHAFPEKYRNALFVLDWTFGRIIVIPRTRDGSISQGTPSTFLTARGQFGFAPTDIAVAPDGSLYFSVGGRGTRGSVYRIAIVASKAKNTTEQTRTSDVTSKDRIVKVLDSPQPLSSWSRAIWEPLAEQLGEQRFIDAALNADLTEQQRIRAIEILTEQFKGISSDVTEQLLSAKPAAVRARAIWALGRTLSNTSSAEVPWNLFDTALKDPDPLVNRIALEALLGLVSYPMLRTDPKWNMLSESLGSLLGSRDRFVREATMRIVKRLPKNSQEQLIPFARKQGARAVLYLVGSTMHSPSKTGLDHRSIDLCTSVLKGDYSFALKLDATRLIQMALADLGPKAKRAAVYEGYGSSLDLSLFERDLDSLRIALAEVYPSGDPDLDFELARLISIVRPLNRDLLNALLLKITKDSYPVDDIHILIVISRLPISHTKEQRIILAKALVSLTEKLQKHHANIDRNWKDRIKEMYHEMVRNDEKLAAEIVRMPEFGKPGHVLFLSEITKQDLPVAIKAFTDKVSANEDYPWTNDVVYVVGESTDEKHRDLIREQFTNYGVRDAVLIVLAEKPDQKDRAKFVTGLYSEHVNVLTSCLTALEKFEEKSNPTELFALYKAALRLTQNVKELELRERMMRLLQKRTRENFGFRFGMGRDQLQRSVFDKWEAWLKKEYPEESIGELGGGESDLVALQNLMKNTDWKTGNIARGEKLFELRACKKCHGGSGALGPDLAGVTGRFALKDLFTAIANPSRDVSARYRTLMIQTTKGTVVTGLIVYESVDGLMLRDGQQKTYRIEKEEIELRRTLTTSLMPAGLLKDLTSQDLADLYVYMQSLQPKTRVNP